MSAEAPEVPVRTDWLRPALARAAFCATAASVAVTVAWVLSHTRVFLAWVLVWPLVGAILVRMGRIVWRTTFRPEPTTSAVALETVLIAVGVALGVLTTTAVLGSPQSWGSNAAATNVLAEAQTRVGVDTTVAPAGADAGGFAGLAERDRQSLAAQALRVGAAILAGAAAGVPDPTTTTTVEPATTTTTIVDAAAETTAVTGPTTSVAGSQRVTTTTAAIGNATVVQRGTTTTTRAPTTVVGSVTTTPSPTTPATTAPPTTPAPTVPTTPAPTTAAPTTTVAPTTTEAPTTTAAPG